VSASSMKRRTSFAFMLLCCGVGCSLVAWSSFSTYSHTLLVSLILALEGGGVMNERGRGELKRERETVSEREWVATRKGAKQFGPEKRMIVEHARIHREWSIYHGHCGNEGCIVGWSSMIFPALLCWLIRSPSSLLALLPLPSSFTPTRHTTHMTSHRLPRAFKRTKVNTHILSRGFILPFFFISVI